jgi:predicted ATP-grasp superfamily ATP-dependent carboligase
VARSLGGAGITVHALGSSTDPVRHSRYCRLFVDLGAAEGVQERWLAWLAARSGDGTVLLPCNDDALELLARHRGELTALGYRVPAADDEVVLVLLDKHETYERARRLGVPAPRTMLLGPEDDAADAAAAVEFPVALKPRHSHLFQRHFGLVRKVFLADDFEELAHHVSQLQALGLEMLVTEIVPGRDDAYHSYYTYVDDSGKPLFELTKWKLRQYPIGFGLSTYHLVDRHEETIEVGTRFVRGMGVRGIACVEFKRDERDGELKLIECNHRVTAAYELIRHAGIDIAMLGYCRAAGLDDPPLGSYRKGVSMWHPVEDLRALVAYRRRGELTIPAWLGSLARRQHFPLLSWHDPKPSLVSISRFPRQLVRRFGR